MKEHQADLARLVMGEDPVGHVAAAARRRLVMVDPDLQRDDRAFRGAGNARPVAPVDDGMRQVEQQRQDARLVHGFRHLQQVAKVFCEARADAVQRADWRKKGIEYRWPHSHIFYDGETHDQG